MSEARNVTVEQVCRTCPVCRGRKTIEFHVLSHESCDGSRIQTAGRKKCRRCDGTGVIPPPDPEPSEQGTWPPGAEAMP